MLKLIFKVGFLLSLCSFVLGKHKTYVATSVLDGKNVVDGFDDDLDVEPFVKVGDKLYHFGQSKVTWFKAYFICRSMGGFLASFDNEEELTALSDYLVKKYPLALWWWISGSDLDSEGDFYWFRTGERITYADWSAGQPDNAGGNENCVHLWYIKPKYRMNDWICKQVANYICEADKPKTIVLSVF